MIEYINSENGTKPMATIYFCRKNPVGIANTSWCKGGVRIATGKKKDIGCLHINFFQAVDENKTLDD